MAFKFLKPKKTSPIDSITTIKDKSVKEDKFGLDALSFYLRLMTDYLSKGRSSRNLPTKVLDKNRTLKTGEYFYASNRIFTKEGVKKMYFLDAFPEQLPVGLIDDLRYYLLEETESFNSKHGTKFKSFLNYTMIGENYDLDFSNRRVKGRWLQLERQYQRVSDKMEEKTLKDELDSDKYDNTVRNKVNSYLYMNQKKKEKHSFFEGNVMLEIVVKAPLGQADLLLYTLENKLYSMCEQLRLVAKPVFLQATEYQKTYSPLASPTRTSLLKDFNPGDLWDDSVFSSFATVEHGKVGDEEGILHGVDLFSSQEVFLNLGATEDAKNILITSATGQGKSGYAKMLYTFLAKDTRYETVVFDIDSEYVPLTKTFRGLVIDFSSHTGSYINTLMINDLTGNEEIDSTGYSDAVQSTERVFNILFEEDNFTNKMSASQLAIFNALIIETYSKYGVNKDNRSTWKNSKKITFFEMYNVLNEMIERKGGISTISIEEVGGIEAFYDFRNHLTPYFDKVGMKSHWFKNRVSEQEVLESKNVIFSFNLSGNKPDDKQLALLQLFASELSMKKARLNKIKGLFTVNIIEEVQRYMNLRHSAEILNELITAGRKLNMINYLNTNKPADLIALEERGTADDQLIGGILGNLQIQIIGALDPTVMKQVIDRWKLHNATQYLNDLSEALYSGKEHPLKYAFFIRYGNQSTIVKQLIHPGLADLTLYRTVDTSGIEEDNEIGNIRVTEYVPEEDMYRQIETAYEKNQNNPLIGEHSAKREVERATEKIKF